MLEQIWGPFDHQIEAHYTSIGKDEWIYREVLKIRPGTLLFFLE